jgi:DnaJ-like protein
MPSVRRDGDRREIIADWDKWIDDKISEAQERGDFDTTPADQPVRLEPASLNPEWDLALSRMKNAGVMPAWMENSRDVEQLSARMRALRERTAAWLAAKLDRYRAWQEAQEALARDQAARPRRWWQRWRPRLAANPPAEIIPPAALEADRQRARREYEALAIQRDKAIGRFHDSLPESLWHLQRLRPPVSKVVAEFDATCPPILAAELAERRPPRCR